LVVGGGLVGVESAATLAGRGHQVRVIDVAARPLDRFHDPLPDLAAEYLAELGIAFTGGVGVDSVLDDGSAAEVRTRTHGTLTADAVLVATGGRPTLPPGLDQLEWPAPVDSDLRLPGHDHVYVVGDLAAPVHAHHGRLPMPHWDMAVRTGVKAAQTIAGEHASLDHVPYWWSEIGEHRLAEYGVASAAESWELEDGLYVGRDAEGDVAAVLVVDEPQRVRQARAMLSRR
jgi:pyruvate/2-oxoglutarate dehydrogenase complex dihydrolipoamide dehydrogenase (E3) component